MDKDLENKNDKNKNKMRESQESQEQFRVVISAEANAAIECALKKVADGFDAGVITKSDIANFVFLNISKFFSEADVKSLRAAHFDDRRMLGALLRNQDDLPDDVKKVIRAHFGVAAGDKKRTSRAPTELSTGSSVDNSSLPPVVA